MIAVRIHREGVEPDGYASLFEGVTVDEALKKAGEYVRHEIRSVAEFHVWELGKPRVFKMTTDVREVKP